MNTDVPPEHLTNAKNTSERLLTAVHEGQREMPEDRPLLVCKPRKIESWRIFKIMSEFIEGFDIIRRYGLAVTFFGKLPSNIEQSLNGPLYRLLSFQ